MVKNNPEKPKQKTQREVERYLKEIDYDGRLERGEYFSNKEYRNLLIGVLEEYLKGKRDQEFVIELGAVFYPEVMTSADKKDDPLMTSVDILDDFSLGYRVPKSEKEKKEILSSILKLLRNKLSLKEMLSKFPSIQ